jgi:hypothetical protein
MVKMIYDMQELAATSRMRMTEQVSDGSYRNVTDSHEL